MKFKNNKGEEFKTTMSDDIMNKVSNLAEKGFDIEYDRNDYNVKISKREFFNCS